MKVAFLDIDGCLNSSDSTMAKIGLKVMSRDQIEAFKQLARLAVTEDDEVPYGAMFALRTADPVAVGLVNRLIRETKCKIVLSSSHRSNFTRHECGFAYESPEHFNALNLFLKAMGLEGELVGVTRAYSGGERGLEVLQYVGEHPEIESYIIIDDGTDFNSDLPLIRCDPHQGFNRENYRQACLQLGAEQSLIITLEEDHLTQ